VAGGPPQSAPAGPPPASRPSGNGAEGDSRNGS
jgi:hypothetical protein